MEMRLELIAIPVSDVDRAKSFYVDQVDDIDAVRAELADRGVEISEVQEMDWGARHAFFQDLDGNGWQLQLPAR